MRYVRRKDGIIFPTQAKEEDIDKSIYVKVAYTIEELCDYYIFWIKDREIPIWERPQIGHRYTEKFWEECYGCVWTDKGLIYVARMNDEGELELL